MLCTPAEVECGDVQKDGRGGARVRRVRRAAGGAGGRRGGGGRGRGGGGGGRGGRGGRGLAAAPPQLGAVSAATSTNVHHTHDSRVHALPQFLKKLHFNSVI